MWCRAGGRQPTPVPHPGRNLRRPKGRGPCKGRSCMRRASLVARCLIGVVASLGQGALARAQSAHDTAGCDGKGTASPDQQIEGCTSVIRLDPRNAAAFNNRGSAYDDKRDYDRAIADYGAAITLNPSYAEAFYNRALAYRRKGDIDHALADYHRSIGLDAGNPAAFNNRGDALMQLGRYVRSIEDFDRALTVNGDYAVAQLDYGLVSR